MLTRVILATILNIFLCTQSTSALESLQPEKDAQMQWLPAPPSPKIIPSEKYPSWEESFDENVICQEGDCGLQQRGPLFFILRGQENLILL